MYNAKILVTQLENIFQCLITKTVSPRSLIEKSRIKLQKTECILTMIFRVSQCQYIEFIYRIDKEFALNLQTTNSSIWTIQIRPDKINLRNWNCVNAVS